MNPACFLIALPNPPPGGRERFRCGPRHSPHQCPARPRFAEPSEVSLSPGTADESELGVTQARNRTCSAGLTVVQKEISERSAHDRRQRTDYNQQVGNKCRDGSALPYGRRTAYGVGAEFLLLGVLVATAVIGRT